MFSDDAMMDIISFRPCSNSDEGDTLQFEPLSSGELQLEVRSNTTGQRLPLENNLILQAARLLRTTPEPLLWALGSQSISAYRWAVD